MLVITKFLFSTVVHIAIRKIVLIVYCVFVNQRALCFASANIIVLGTVVVY